METYFWCRSDKSSQGSSSLLLCEIESNGNYHLKVLKCSRPCTFSAKVSCTYKNRFRICELMDKILAVCEGFSVDGEQPHNIGASLGGKHHRPSLLGNFRMSRRKERYL
jgi:hypothetical protein